MTNETPTERATTPKNSVHAAVRHAASRALRKHAMRCQEPASSHAQGEVPRLTISAVSKCLQLDGGRELSVPNRMAMRAMSLLARTFTG